MNVIFGRFQHSENCAETGQVSDYLDGFVRVRIIVNAYLTDGAPQLTQGRHTVPDSWYDGKQDVRGVCPVKVGILWNSNQKRKILTQPMHREPHKTSYTV